MLRALLALTCVLLIPTMGSAGPAGSRIPEGFEPRTITAVGYAAKKDTRREPRAPGAGDRLGDRVFEGKWNRRINEPDAVSSASR